MKLEHFIINEQNENKMKEVTREEYLKAKKELRRLESISNSSVEVPMEWDELVKLMNIQRVIIKSYRKG
jgi:hypothetical protein